MSDTALMSNRVLGWTTTSNRTKHGRLLHRGGEPRVDVPRRGRQLDRAAAPAGAGAAAAGVRGAYSGALVGSPRKRSTKGVRHRSTSQSEGSPWRLPGAARADTSIGTAAAPSANNAGVGTGTTSVSRLVSSEAPDQAGPLGGVAFADPRVGGNLALGVSAPAQSQSTSPSEPRGWSN